MDEEKTIFILEAEDNASSKIDKVTKSVKNMNSEMNSTKGSANSGASGIEGFASGLMTFNNSINNSLRRYNQSMINVNRVMVNTFKDAASLIKDFTKESINNLTELSEQHAKTMGAMANSYPTTTAGKKQFASDSSKLQDQAIQYGTYGQTNKGSLYTTTQVSELQTELVKAGVKPKDILNSNVTKDVLTFAQANDLPSSKAVEFAVSLGNQFGYKPKQWGSMLDQVSHTADLSVIDVKDIVQSMKYAGGITAGLHRPMSETLSLISNMGNFGLKGSQSGSSIQALYTKLLTGDTTVITDAMKEVAPKKALKAFYDFSNYAKSDGSPKITYDDIKNGTFEKKDITGNLRPMSEVVDSLDKVMSGLNDEEQAWFAKKFFGLYQMKGAYALINGDDSNIKDTQKQIETMSGGTNKNKLNLLLDSQYGQLTTLDKLWEGVETDFGDKISGTVDSVRDELFNFFKNNGDYNINFDHIRNALKESTKAIEDKYGSAIAGFVDSVGNFGIDFSQIGANIAPEFTNGISDVFTNLVNGDLSGVTDSWSDMISDMNSSVKGLPEELQGMGKSVVSIIDWIGKLVTINVATQIAEVITSVFKLINITTAAIHAGYVTVTGTGSVASSGTAVGTSNISKSISGIGVVGAITGTLVAGGGMMQMSDINNPIWRKDEDNVTSGALKIGGVATGAGVGATVGSIVPGIGTATGAGVGAGVGGLLSLIFGDSWASDINNYFDGTTKINDSMDSARTAQNEFNNAVNRNNSFNKLKTQYDIIKEKMANTTSGTSDYIKCQDNLKDIVGKMNKIYPNLIDNMTTNLHTMDKSVDAAKNMSDAELKLARIRNAQSIAKSADSSDEALNQYNRSKEKASEKKNEYNNKEKEYNNAGIFSAMFNNGDISAGLNKSGEWNGVKFNKNADYSKYGFKSQKEAENWYKQYALNNIGLDGSNPSKYTNVFGNDILNRGNSYSQGLWKSITGIDYYTRGMLTGYKEEQKVDNNDAPYQKYKSGNYGDELSSAQKDYLTAQGDVNNKLATYQSSLDMALSNVDSFIDKKGNILDMTSYQLAGNSINKLIKNAPSSTDTSKASQKLVEMEQKSNIDFNMNGIIDKPISQKDIYNTVLRGLYGKDFSSKLTEGTAAYNNPSDGIANNYNKIVGNNNKTSKALTNQNININPLKNQITLTPNIIINTKVDKNGNVSMTNTQMSQLFTQMITFGESKQKKFGD